MKRVPKIPSTRLLLLGMLFCGVWIATFGVIATRVARPLIDRGSLTDTDLLGANLILAAAVPGVLGAFACSILLIARLIGASPNDSRRLLRASLLVLMMLGFAHWVTTGVRTASGGRIVEGQHYLGSHGQYWPVSESRFHQHRWREMFLLSTWCIMLGCGFGQWLTMAEKERDRAFKRRSKRV